MRANRLNLLTHCGADVVEESAVYDAATGPALGNRHTPIPHGELLNVVKEKLDDTGFDLIQSVHALTRDDARYFGMMEVAPPVTSFANDDFSLIIGLRNSHDMRFPAGLVVGSGVFVCDNLCFSGEIKIGRKHTPKIMEDLPKLVENAVASTGAMADRQRRRFEDYRRTPIEKRFGDAMIVEAFRRGIIGVNKVATVVKEWDEPSHDEHAEGGFTAWRLFNAFTQAMKPTSANQASTLTTTGPSLHRFVDERVDEIAA